jgi:hypothetical protein
LRPALILSPRHGPRRLERWQGRCTRLIARPIRPALRGGEPDRSWSLLPRLLSGPRKQKAELGGQRRGAGDSLRFHRTPGRLTDFGLGSERAPDRRVVSGGRVGHWSGYKKAGRGEAPPRSTRPCENRYPFIFGGKNERTPIFRKANTRGDRVRVVYLSFLALGSSSITSLPLNGSPM